jgi:hypothetical protein
MPARKKPAAGKSTAKASTRKRAGTGPKTATPRTLAPDKVNPGNGFRVNMIASGIAVTASSEDSAYAMAREDFLEQLRNWNYEYGGSEKIATPNLDDEIGEVDVEMSGRDDDTFTFDATIAVDVVVTHEKDAFSAAKHRLQHWNGF